MADQNESKTAGGGKRALADTDIRTQLRVPRRSVFPMVGGALVGVAAGARPASALTDADSPNFGHADPVCEGRGGGSGVVDTDGGSRADQPGRGRGLRTTALTDTDGGPNADPAGQGRGITGITDGDSGCYSDEANRGRGSAGGGAK